MSPRAGLWLLLLCLPRAALAAPCAAGAVQTTAGQAFQDCEDAPLMVVIPAGAFRMGDLLGTGSVYEKPVHEVHLRSFALARYEVTQAQWAACRAAGACDAQVQAQGGSQLPVTGVSWEQARRYAEWLSARSGRRYRLPSEAQWEYAARAGSAAQFTWGNLAEPACEHANSFDRAGHRANPQWGWQIECDDGHAVSAPVGSYPANGWGLHDMLGNVWEWVDDCWHGDYTAAPADGSAWIEDGCRKRVNRGGGWGNHPRSLRVSQRDADEATARSDGLGFRVARELP